MRRRTLALVAALAVATASPAAPAPASPGDPAVHAACKSARILGKRKCIARGQFCTHTNAANRDYHRYGLHCGKADRNGRYHLVSY
jgi:Spy/CpxP family protein refolding chaperone